MHPNPKTGIWSSSDLKTKLLAFHWRDMRTFYIYKQSSFIQRLFQYLSLIQLRIVYMCLPKCLYCTGWMNKHITNIGAIEIRRHCCLNNWRCFYWLNLQTLYLSIQPIHLQTLIWQCCLIEIFPEAYPNLCGQRVMQTTYHLKALARCLRIPRESHSSSWWLLTRCEVWHHIQDGPPRDLGPFQIYCVSS